MSELRIGLAVEGQTDALVLEAGLNAFLENPFVSVLLQPETPPGRKGTGWSGVFWWCRQIASQGYTSLRDNPVLELIDLAIIQIDADVAGMSYKSANISNTARGHLKSQFEYVAHHNRSLALPAQLNFCH